MFSGIIKNTGKINKIFKAKKDCTLEIISNIKFSKDEIGSSISCSGACLTLENYKKNLCSFYISKETLSKTIFKFCKKGDIINLEKSLRFGDRISGHFVQGHVDTTCQTKTILHLGKSWEITFNLSKNYKKYLIQKGSIAINGVSLTIAKIVNNGFKIVVIPQTLKQTNLILLKKKDQVNIEFDLFGKYMKNFIK